MNDANDRSEIVPQHINRRDLMVAAGGVAAMWASANVGFGAAAADTGTRLSAPDYTPGDTFFGKAYIDVDEWRDKPTRFRYVHGGFEGTDTRFAFYFPDKQNYRNRFFQTLPGGVGGSETGILDAIKNYDQFGVVPPLTLLAAFDNNGYIIESNQGHFGNDMSGLKGQIDVLAYRASAETARFARLVAAQMYGAPPKYGYLFGGSGGAVRTINCLEHVQGIWDGGVPIVSPMQRAGTFFSVVANAVRVMPPDVIARIADANDVGGSGRCFEGLTNEQAQALQTLYQSGFPRRIGFANPAETVLVWTFNAYAMSKQDPTYFDDFWNKPGYIGHDQPEILAKDRILVRTRVKRVLTAGELQTYQPPVPINDELGWGPTRSRARPADPSRPAAIILENPGPRLSRMGCANITFTSGAATGRERFVMAVIGDALEGGGLGKELLEGVKAGDEVTIDNDKYLAFCFLYRHQVEPEFQQWAHSVSDGQPIYVQRPLLAGDSCIFPYTFTVGTRKLIFVSSLQDRGVFMSGVCSTMQEIKRIRGEEFFRKNVRLWFNDHAWHGAPPPVMPDERAPVYATKLINYEGSVHRALRSLVAWVEQGTEPLPSTAYDFTPSCNVTVPTKASERKGVQPAIALTANGAAERLEIKSGEAVNFVAVAECPPGAGTIVLAEWDFDGAGRFPYKNSDIDGKQVKAEIKARHVFDQPGTYFPCIRAASHPTGDLTNPLYRVPNLGRIRIVVT